jgi:hypothetical protein
MSQDAPTASSVDASKSAALDIDKIIEKLLEVSGADGRDRATATEATSQTHGSTGTEQCWQRARRQRGATTDARHMLARCLVRLATAES